MINLEDTSIAGCKATQVAIVVYQMSVLSNELDSLGSELSDDFPFYETRNYSCIFGTKFANEQLSVAASGLFRRPRNRIEASYPPGILGKITSISFGQFRIYKRNKIIAKKPSQCCLPLNDGCNSFRNGIAHRLHDCSRLKPAGCISIQCLCHSLLLVGGELFECF